MTDKTKKHDKKNSETEAEILLDVMIGLQKMVLEQKPHIKEYKKIRKLHAEILEGMMDYYRSGKFDCGEIYNEFDLNSTVGNKAFVDAVVYKNTQSKKNIAEEFLEGNRYRKPEKIEFLQSMVESKTGFFCIFEIDSTEGYAFIEEVFSGSKYKIIDIGMSGALNYGDFYTYTRIISYRGVSFSTGLNLIFHKDDPFIEKFIKNEKKNYSPEKEFDRFIKLYNHFYESVEEVSSETENEKIFARYNPADAVTRCPNGRAHVRKLLDAYAKAAVNLYGAISVKEFVEIFNSQNIDQTSADEVFSLLLPLVLKSEWYCFYKDFIVHYWAIEDFEYADSWLQAQGDKPRFIPEKDDFLKFADGYHESEKQNSCWMELLVFIGEEWPDNHRKYRFYDSLKQMSEFSSGASELNELFEEYEIVFKGEKQAQAFFDLFMNARNNSRMWANKGYTPTELAEIMQSQAAKNGSPKIVYQNKKKIGQNERCPCGSGKKYKKCCKMTEDAKTAQLSQSECEFFYETWYELLAFVNEKKKVVENVEKQSFPNYKNDERLYKVRQILWDNPSLIDDYIKSTKLSGEEVNLLESWRDYYKKDIFILVDYTHEYAIAIGRDEHKEDRLYGIKGISRSFADVIQRELPVQFETVLLPFKDKIIYDTFVSSAPVSFGEGAKRALAEIHEKTIDRGIIARLG